MNRTTRAWFVVLAGAAISASGCCKGMKDGDDIASAVASSDPGIEDPGESHRDSKVDRTIKCYNAAMQIDKAANHYFRRLRNGKPRPGRTPSIAFKPPDHINKTCEEAKADQTPPMPEIDKIMPAYVESVAKLSKQLDEMDQYYRLGEHKSDKYKKGKEMHEVFKKDHEAFKKLHDQLGNAIDVVADKRDDDAIQKESKSKGLRYFSLVFLRDAKHMSREITKDKPDKDAFAGLKTKVLASHKAFLNHANQHPEQVSKAFMFNMYKSRADDFIRSIHDADASKLKARDLENMLNKYNFMIDASNVVRWRS